MTAAPKSIIPDKFQFSQASLQAFVDCPRLFQLRYIERLAWPALKTGSALEAEYLLNLGSNFHKLIQQKLIGVPDHFLQGLANQDALLAQWWSNFQTDGPDLEGYAQYPEVSLSTPLGGYRLVATFDLLSIAKSAVHKASLPDPGLPKMLSPDRSAIIYDWKTSRKKPERKRQAGRLQTIVYPYVLLKAGVQFCDGNTFHADQVTMIYWYANFPTQPMAFHYATEKFSQDESYLLELINAIKVISGKEAPKTTNEKRCRYCVYRSLCGRGIAAGTINEFEGDIEEPEDLAIDFDLDFDQIAEIEF